MKTIIIDKELVKQDYLKGMKYKDLASKYNISINNIKGWVKRYSWAKEKGVQNKGTVNEQKGTCRKRVQLDKKEEVLTLAAVGKSKNAISKKVGISRSTVTNIINLNSDELDNYRQQKKEEFINKSWETVNNALEYGNQKIVLATVASESFDDRIEDLINALKDNEADPRTISETVKAIGQAMNIPLRDVATYLGTIYDKIALATGNSTSNVNLHQTGNLSVDLSQLTNEELNNLEKIATKLEDKPNN